jgi:DNA-binding transcriptional MerR regulator
MKTVHEISDLTGLSIRTLQYYDKTGLLKPAAYSEAGYRLYDESSLMKIQQIMLFRELEFPLKDIKTILDDPDFDKTKALEAQIELLKLKKEQIDKLIVYAELLLKNGGNDMDFDAFDKSKLKEYAEKARETWGNTQAYSEYEEKSKGRTDAENGILAKEMMDIFRDIGRLKDLGPESEEVKVKIRELQDHITKNYYKCTDEILKSLGTMYASGGEFTKNIDKAAGEGTAVFVNEAIKACI